MIGPAAEFLNAYSALLRLFSGEPEIPDSLVAQLIGETGELLVVVLINMLIGGLLTVLYRMLYRR